MGLSPSSSVQRARQELADRMRELRREAGLTARALSTAAAWHEAKTSRIESAKQAPSENDIRAWCDVCGVPGQALDLIAASRAADSAYIEWRRRGALRAGRGPQRRAEIEAELADRVRFRAAMRGHDPSLCDHPVRCAAQRWADRLSGHIVSTNVGRWARVEARPGVNAALG